MKIKEFNAAVLAHTINAMRDHCHEAADAAGWWFQRTLGMNIKEVIRTPTTPLQTFIANNVVGTKLALIHSEVSEAMEGHRKGKMDEHLPHLPSINVELADAYIRICDLAGAMNIDLGQAVAEKMAYNATRADHKPENREAPGGKAY